jgi:hypothetical protein
MGVMVTLALGLVGLTFPRIVSLGRMITVENSSQVWLRVACWASSHPSRQGPQDVSRTTVANLKHRVTGALRVMAKSTANNQ